MKSKKWLTWEAAVGGAGLGGLADGSLEQCSDTGADVGRLEEVLVEFGGDLGEVLVPGAAAGHGDDGELARGGGGGGCGDDGRRRGHRGGGRDDGRRGRDGGVDDGGGGVVPVGILCDGA